MIYYMNPICRECTENDYRMYPILRKYECDNVVLYQDGYFHDMPLISCLEARTVFDTESKMLAEFRKQSEQTDLFLAPPYGRSENFRHAIGKLWDQGFYGLQLCARYQYGDRDL